MNPEQAKQYAEELKAREEQFNRKIAVLHVDRVKTHVKKEFTFSVIEKRRLLQQEEAHMIADQATNDILNLSVLPRIGAVPNKDTHIFYDSALGKFVIWVPKTTPTAKPADKETTPATTSEQPQETASKAE